MKAIRPPFLFALALALFAAVIVYTFRQVDLRSIVGIVTPGSLAWVLFLGLALFCAFGLLLRVGFLEQYGVRLGYSEVLTLPLMMVLFTYILPLNGGLLFQVFYMRHRHQLDLSKGFSLGLMVFCVSVVVTVVAGLGLYYYLQLHHGPVLYFLLVLALGLMALPVLLGLVPNIPPEWPGILGRLVAFLVKTKHQLKAQLRNVRLLVRLMLADAAVVVVQAFWYQNCAGILGFDPAFLPMLLVALVLRVALLLRLLPGNLGVQELVIGVVYGAAGFTMAQGLLLALVIRLVSVLLAATVGVAGLYANLHLLKIKSVPSLVREISGAR